MKNIAEISVGPAFRSLETLARRLPEILLIQHVRVVEIITLSLVVLAGAVVAMQLLFGQTVVPDSVERPPASLHDDKIPRIERAQQQRAQRAQQGMRLAPRLYFELPAVTP